MCVCCAVGWAVTEGSLVSATTGAVLAVGPHREAEDVPDDDEDDTDDEAGDAQLLRQRYLALGLVKVRIRVALYCNTQPTSELHTRQCTSINILINTK